MVGWHHRLDGHESEQTQGVGEGQESLACCSPWGCKESDITEQLNTTTNNLLQVGHQVKIHKQYYLILFQIEITWLCLLKHAKAVGLFSKSWRHTWESMQDSWNCCVNALISLQFCRRQIMLYNNSNMLNLCNITE